MEKFIYLLVPIAIFLFKAFQNFQKEQEKAAKRTGAPSNPPSTPAPVQNRRTINQPQQRNDSETIFDATDFLREKQEAQNQRQSVVKNYKSANNQNPKDYYNPEIPTQEVKEGRRIHEPHHHEFEFPKQAVEKEIDFDLRQAVIQQAILNRPNF